MPEILQDFPIAVDPTRVYDGVTSPALLDEWWTLHSSGSPVVGAVHYWKTHGPDFATNQAAKPGLTLLDRGFGYKNTNVFFAENGAESFGNLALQGSISNIAEFLNGSGKVIGLMALGFLAWKWFV